MEPAVIALFGAVCFVVGARNGWAWQGAVFAGCVFALAGLSWWALSLPAGPAERAEDGSVGAAAAEERAARDEAA